MFQRIGTAALALALAAALVACTRQSTTPGAAEPPTQSAESAPDAEQTPAKDPARAEHPAGVAIKKVSGREYMMYGEVMVETSEIELTVEDGHNVLFGPAWVPVRNGWFRIDFVIDETDQDQAMALIRVRPELEQMVVPIQFDQDLMVAGAPFDINTVPEAGAEQMGDRRTRVTAEGIESPHFKVRWPAISEGETTLRLEGQTDLHEFWVEIRDGDEVLTQTYLGGEQNANGTWHEFQANVTVPGEGGFRAEYAVVLLGPTQTDVELYFQPIRN